MARTSSAAPALDWKAIERQARRRFGITDFRPGQRELIEAVIAGRDAPGVMPTGAGKYPHREESQRVYEALNHASAGHRRNIGLRDLIADTGLSERRVKVIVAQLEQAGVLQRQGRGLRQQRRFADGGELERFLHEYEKRYATERERLQAMMRYA